MMFDAVLFDLDGTLIDSEAVAIRTGMAAFVLVGQPVGIDFLHGLIGKDNPTASGLINATFPALDITQLNAVWSQGFQAAMQHDVPLKPFVHDLLTRISQPCVLVTSSRRHEAHDKLARARLAQYFDHVVALEDVTAPKPAPDPYLLAASLVNAAPGRCLVFEDSETGAQAAHRAGCVVVQVPDIVPSSGRWAHHVSPDLMAGATAAGLVITAG
jgi:HAD superfamily hydrolase (TIGR01509 family)